MSQKPRVVILGAGFGGLWAVRQLRNQPVDIVLIDKNNYHTFLPLLYQVAAAELEPERIAQSVRSIVRDQENVAFRLGEAIKLEPNKREVVLNGPDKKECFGYDYLIAALGSVTNFFGVEGAAEYCYTLKSVEQGIILRNQILRQVEESVYATDAAEKEKKLTFVIIGGGPTGVEYSGALAELLYRPLEKDFPDIDLRQNAKVILVEAQDELLRGIGGGDYAHRRLEKIGVDVRLNAQVEKVTENQVHLADGTVIGSETIIWTAGVRGVPLLDEAGFETVRSGRISVRPTLQTPSDERVFVVGDLAYFEQDGQPLPWVAQVAMQQGEQAAKNIMHLIKSEPLEPFAYRDKGSMATVGRNAAVTNMGGRVFTGFFAWLLWLAVHIFFLIGFRNRLGVLVNWAWNYIFYERVVRLILPTLPAKRPVSES